MTYKPFDPEKYRLYLESERWLKKREKVLERDGHCCTLCTSIDTLQVHHKTYIRLYRERVSDLTTLCKKCHEGVTTMLRKRRGWTGLKPLSSFERRLY